MTDAALGRPRPRALAPRLPVGREGVARALFVVPLLLSLGVVLAYPTAWLLALALSESTLGRPFLAFAGLSQVADAATDPAFLWSLGRSVLFAVPVSAAEVALGVAIALLVHRLARAGRWLSVLILLPLMTPPVMVAIAWKLILAPSGGLVNGWLLGAGLVDQPVSFFSDGTLAWASIALADAWQWTPFVVLLTVAALRSLPPEVLEAARLDCPSAWARLRHVTLPLLGPTLASVFLLKLIIALKLFDLIYVLTFGGPGTATSVAAFHVWRTGLEQFDVGAAAAQTLLFGAVAGLVTLPAVWLARRAARAEG